MSKEAPKMAEGPAPAAAPAPLPPPKPEHKRRWGQKEYPSKDFVRVTFLVTGGLSGEHWTRGKSGDVPKEVFEGELKPRKVAKLWEKPKPAPKFNRPATDVGSFRRR